MNAEFWKVRWRESRTGWHRETVNPALDLWDVPREAHVLVPLCGRSVDVGWLAERGHRVTGVELSEVAIEEFFSNAGLKPTREDAGPFVRWTAGPITLMQGDFFALEGSFDALYDRAALIALPQRAAYAQRLHQLVDGPGLLVTIEYPQHEKDGPPFSVSHAEVEERFDVTLLRETDISDEFKSRGVSAATLRVYRCSL